MSKSSILIVEDESIVAADLAAKLRQLGYEVAGTAASGEEAVLQANRLNPDLVLMDIQLEGSTDGIEAAEAIRSQLDLPIIYLTAHSDAATLSRAKLSGPFGFILKPFEERELATNIEMALYKHEADRQLRQQRDELEVRTAELQSANETLRSSRLAALNLMDDAVVAREIAEKTSLELQKEIAERMRAEQSLRESEDRVRRKLDSVLSPEGDIGDLELSDIIDTGSIQALMDDFYSLAHMPMAIIDLSGKMLVGVGWQKICTEFHRVHPETCRNCIESDLQLSAGVRHGEFKLYKCKNHMWDVATPIIVGGKHMGNLFMGQFFFMDEPLDHEFFRSQAGQYGFDEEKYIEALEAVPRLTREQLNTSMAFFLKLANILSKSSYGTLKLARALAEREALSDSLRRSEQRLVRAQEIAHLGSWELDLLRDQLTWSDEVYRIFGLQPQEFAATYEAFLKRIHPDDRAAVDSTYTSSVKEGKDSYEIEHRIVRRGTGEIRWVHEKCQHVRDDTGRIIRSIGMVHDVTDRKKAEEVIGRFAAIVENAEDAIIGKDLNGIIQTWNDGAERIFGYTAKEAIGRNVSFLTPYGHIDETPGIIEGIIRGEHIARFETERMRKDGTVIPVSMTYSPIKNARGRIIGISKTAHDISERKKTEAELLRLNKAFKALSDSSQAIVRAHDEAEYLDRTCRIVIEDCGYSMAWIGYAEDDEAKSVRPVAHAGFEAGYLETLRISWADTERGRGPTGTAIRTGNISVCRNMLTDPVFAPWRENAIERGYASSIVFPLKAKDRVFGSLTIYSPEADPFSEAEVKLLTELSDNLAYGIEVLRARVARAKAEQALRESKQRLLGQNSILEGINLIFQKSLNNQSQKELGEAYLAVIEEITRSNIGFIAEADADGQLSNLAGSNPAWEICTMYDKKEYQETAGNSRVLEVCRRVLAEGKGFFMNDLAADPDFPDKLEEHPLQSFLGVPLLHGGRTIGMIGVANRDGGYRQEELNSLEALAPAIVESLYRIRAEEELHKLTAELKRSNDDLQQFARFASHDLQAPLKTAEGFVRLFVKRYKGKLDEQGDNLLGYILESTRDMQTLIKDLLEFSRIETGSYKIAPVDTSLSLAHALANLKTEIDENNAEVTYDEPMPVVMGDRTQIIRLFQNLIGNAIKFHGEATPKIHISVLQKDGDRVFSGADNGIGIDPKYYGHIFDIFRRLHGKSEFPGTGMGLAMCKRIVERMGGRIWVESESGKGSTFFFTLPVQKGQHK